MSEKEKKILKELTNSIKNLSEADKRYVVGVADGLSIAKGNKKEEKAEKTK